MPASTANGDNIEDPHFSPDGTKVVFTQRLTDENDAQRRTGLWIVDLDSSALTPLVSAEQGSYDPAWSPDGKWIAFVERNGKSNDLWVIAATGGPATKLTDGRSIASPAWAPDGTTIGFFEVDGASFKVSFVTFTVAANGVGSASKPDKLFSADAIDAPSGFSWVK